MKTYNAADIRTRFGQLGFKWFPFHLVGVRSAEDKPNVFDDQFFLFKGDDLFNYAGTTNPGTYWLQNPMNVEGAAVMVANQQCIDCWELGRHKGVHKAWVQTKPIKVFRDNDRDLKSEETDNVDAGLFGINIHRASNEHRSKQIDKWSAGCQVFADPTEHNQLIYFSEKSGLKFFTYTLLKEW